jgi:hypothetical protein
MGSNGMGNEGSQYGGLQPEDQQQQGPSYGSLGFGGVLSEVYYLYQIQKFSVKTWSSRSRVV